MKNVGLAQTLSRQQVPLLWTWLTQFYGRHNLASAVLWGHAPIPIPSGDADGSRARILRTEYPRAVAPQGLRVQPAPEDRIESMPVLLSLSEGATA